MNTDTYVGWLRRLLEEKPELAQNRSAQIKALRAAHKLTHAEAYEVVMMVARGEQPPVTADELRELLAEETTKRRLATQRIRWAAFIAGLTLLLIEFALYFKNGKFDGFPIVSILALSATLAAGASGKLKLAVREAAFLQDKRSLGALLEIMNSGDATVIEVVRPAIAKIMRGLEPGEIVLDAQQRAVIHKLLGEDKETDFVIALLAGLRAVGDTKDIEVVEKVAEGTMNVPKADREQVASLARMALADMRMNRARELITEQTGPIVIPEQVLREVEEQHLST